MRNLRYLSLYITKLFQRYTKRVAISLFILGVVGFVLIQTKNLYTSKSISEGVVGTYTQEDLPLIVTHLLSKSLVSLNQSGKPEPNMLSEWKISQDGKVYTVKLKDDLYWTDKTPVKAEDITVAIPDVESRVVDDKTIEFTLADTYSPFLTLLTKPILKKNTNMGVGPYRIESITKDIVFIKKVVLKPISKDLPEVSIKFYPNEKIAKNALKTGEVQSLLGVSEVEDFNNQKPFAIYSITNFNRLVTIFYNNEDPILSDSNFRLALSFAAPVISGEERAKTPISTKSWSYNDSVKEFLDNPSQAKIHLNKVQNGKDTPIVLTVTSSLKNIGERVVDTWNRNGIKAVMRVESGLPQNFQALLISQKIPADPDQYSLWHKLGQTNISKFSSPRTDKDLEDGRKLLDYELRKAKYVDFQKVLLDNAPATFLYFPKYNVVYFKKKEDLLKPILDLQLVPANL